jgi:hypothetical protein
MNHMICVVHEAEADFVMATELADRVFIESVDWLEPELMQYQRDWVQFNPDGERLTWGRLKQLAKNANVAESGFFNGSPGQPDALAGRRAILYLKTIFPDISAILLIRDQDNQPERKIGLEQARQEHTMIPIILGLAIIEREAWVSAGFSPHDEKDQTLLDAERQLLGFYPHEQSHRLTAGKDDNAKLSPKRVLQVLCGGNKTRERLCWTQTPLATLRERGTDNGLSHYLDEVRTRLVPLFGNTKP